MKTTVIYHSADNDGLFCREIARKFLPDSERIGWDFKDPPLAIPTEGQIYILDLPVDRVFGFNLSTSEPTNFISREIQNRLVWIDHHKSSIESHPSDIPGYRIDGVSACRLAWQWFAMPCVPALYVEWQAKNTLPSKQDFLNRKVSEPLAVRLAGEYDIHDSRMVIEPDIELFQHGLRSQELTDEVWINLLNTEDKYSAFVKMGVEKLLRQGRVLQFSRDNEYRDVITQQGFDIEFEGVKFLACNSHELDIRSQLFVAGIKPNHEALLGFTFNGTDWRVSMYWIDDRPNQPDILAIAKKYKGGGHPGACGCRIVKLPFIP